MSANQALRLNMAKPIGERQNTAETVFQANKAELWAQIMGEVEAIRATQREREAD